MKQSIIAAVVALASVVAPASVMAKAPTAKALAEQFIDGTHKNTHSDERETNTIGVVCPAGVLAGEIVVTKATYALDGSALGSFVPSVPSDMAPAPLDYMTSEFADKDVEQAFEDDSKLKPVSSWYTFKYIGGNMDFEIFRSGKVTVKIRPHNKAAQKIACKLVSAEAARGE